MNKCQIYLSGGMSNLSFEEQNKWRLQVKDAVLNSNSENAHEKDSIEVLVKNY